MSEQNNANKGIFASVTDTVGTVGKNLGETVGNTVGSVGAGVGNAITDISSGAGKTLSDGSQGLKNTTDAVGKTYSDNAPEVLGGKSSK